mmetsp:Transcript_10493/g.18007  ORF Transcript_10493/g.18007 Transcript_10493/m.18007 type:complete len:664 (+) Transcript_10493:151-2142(+)
MLEALLNSGSRKAVFGVLLSCAIATYVGCPVTQQDDAGLHSPVTTCYTMVADKKVIDLAACPRWDLERHFGYKNPSDPAIDADLGALEVQCKQFQQNYDGKLDEHLLQAIRVYESIVTGSSKISSYISLSYDTQLENTELQKRKGAINQRMAEVSGDYLTFFELQLAELPDDAVHKQMEATPELRSFDAYIKDTRKEKPHNLSQEVERALTVRSPYTGTSNVVDFYERALSKLRFQLDDEKDLNLEVLLSRLSNSKDAGVRQRALQTLNDGLEQVEDVAALSLNVVMGSWLIEKKERNHTAVRSRRNLSNNVPDKVVDALLEAVRGAGTPLCKRHYSLKKALLHKTQGLDKFTWADRNAALDIGAKDQDETYTWEEAVAAVKSGYQKFSPTMADLFQGMVDEKRIDVPAVDGKKGGAYCSAAVPGIGPFQLLNFEGTKGDVMTLAHESGHGCHDILAYPQGILQFHPPLTLAETASIFGEMIVFRDLLAKAPSKEDRLAMLMSKIDDIVNSVVRQCSFDNYEQQVHEARAKGQLAPADFCQMWEKSVVDYYGAPGEIFDSYDDSSHLWTYVSHFHNVPFYVYSYAFADLVVGSLYGVYQQSSDGFEDKLLELLRAGGTKGFVEALAPFGLDPSQPDFWTNALEAHLGGLLNEAEELSKELGYL